MSQSDVREDERVRANRKLIRLTTELQGVDTDVLRAADPDICRDFAAKHSAVLRSLMSVTADKQVPARDIGHQNQDFSVEQRTKVRSGDAGDDMWGFRGN